MTETQRLAAALRAAGYQKLLPVELAEYLLSHGYSRTSVTFDLATEAASSFDAAVADALQAVEP